MRRLLALIGCLVCFGLPAAVFATVDPSTLPIDPSIDPSAASVSVNPAVTVQARVTSIERDWIDQGVHQVIFRARTDAGTEYFVDTSEGYLAAGLRYDVRLGTQVILQIVPNEDGSTDAFLSDVVRVRGLFWIFLIFCVVALIVGLWRGLFGLLCLAVTIAVLFGFIFPRILAGGSPIPITVIGSVVILAVNMHVSHGFNRRTFAAFLSTVVGLGFALGTSVLFVKLGALSGLASEEAHYLFLQLGSYTYTQGLLLAAIILGAVGVLDDIAITQSETVAEIALADPSLSIRELFLRSMRVGRHHIASVINTLVLAYVGVAMPLFLLFLSMPELKAFDFLNTEAVAEEIVRTLAGTIALILTVPLSSLLAAWVSTRRSESTTHFHHR